MTIGHVHLKIRDLPRSIEFYRHFLGLQVTEKLAEHFVFMSAGKMHHELALQEVGMHAASPASHAVGLYHIAFEVPDRQALASTYRKLKGAGVPVSKVDHRISWAIYFNDPDGNGVEVYWDTRQTAQGAARWDGVDRPLHDEQLQ